MYLDKLGIIDWVIVCIVGFLFIGAIIYMIKNRKTGKSINCSNCPLASKCDSRSSCNKE